MITLRFIDQRINETKTNRQIYSIHYQGIEEGQKYQDTIRGSQRDTTTRSAIASRIPRDENSSYPAFCMPAKESRII